jgi:hypothetical protein
LDYVKLDNKRRELTNTDLSRRYGVRFGITGDTSRKCPQQTFRGPRMQRIRG